MQQTESEKYCELKRQVQEQQEQAAALENSNKQLHKQLEMRNEEVSKLDRQLEMEKADKSKMMKAMNWEFQNLDWDDNSSVASMSVASVALSQKHKQVRDLESQNNHYRLRMIKKQKIWGKERAKMTEMGAEAQKLKKLVESEKARAMDIKQQWKQEVKRAESKSQTTEKALAAAQGIAEQQKCEIEKLERKQQKIKKQLTKEKEQFTEAQKALEIVCHAHKQTKRKLEGAELSLKQAKNCLHEERQEMTNTRDALQSAKSTLQEMKRKVEHDRDCNQSQISQIEKLHKKEQARVKNLHVEQTSTKDALARAQQEVEGLLLEIDEQKTIITNQSNEIQYMQQMIDGKSARCQKLEAAKSKLHTTPTSSPWNSSPTAFRQFLPVRTQRSRTWKSYIQSSRRLQTTSFKMCLHCALNILEKECASEREKRVALQKELSDLSYGLNEKKQELTTHEMKVHCHEDELAMKKEEIFAAERHLAKEKQRSETLTADLLTLQSTVEAKENTVKALLKKVQQQDDTIEDQKNQVKEIKLLNNEEQERAAKIQEQLPQLFQLIKAEETKSLNCRQTSRGCCQIRT
ncbi:unnamed protein product [Cylindrotheca closterium]|uniref:Uncharacterized protein n=1 Tax=Cylindrotheca closterium TaxID=2856 RepID=A0AAD2CR31_9STRA|nr:unnamed protein product [Cylindrotheca closterium]